MRTRRIPALAPLLVLIAAAALVVAGCGGDDDQSSSSSGGSSAGTTASTRSAPAIDLREVGRFDKPVDAVAVPGTDQVAVVEQTGRVIVVSGMSCASRDRCPDRPVTDGTVVLDLTGTVSTGNEQGLLGLAFHPDWPQDPRIFIDYTDRDGTTHVEAWTMDTPTATAVRRTELLRIPQPYSNHNGGDVLFGPDGLLYVGTGDGGDAGDPGDRAQEDDELLGKLLRLDVDRGGERGYAIPKGNQSTGAAEVFALGLRNPWRFSFDAQRGDLWIGDVGQDTWEELDVLPRARLESGPTPNFGWRRHEGYADFDTSGKTGPGELQQPVLAYGRKEGCSITGGFVYRGALVPDLDGWYVFADFCGDDLRLIDAADVPGSSFDQGELTWASVDGVEQAASFAQVQHDELLVLSLDGGIWQVVPA
ncbi:MAG: PQQ-dependent sugar dehydrogenase [Thermoleophilia bacterium]|nr:PQQ-dependent sugar dehydrogenase [Thermoleophilia bacterium]